tara:strand:+ start:66 stop:296 length:231 start_codon:yes stop_codon:yes gene_type:complete
MANFLGFSNEEIENNRKISKQERIKKWEDLGFLDGLELMNRTDLTQLYGGEASQLISETQTKSGFKPKNKIKKHKL